MNMDALLAGAKLHARIEHDEDDADVLLMLSTAVRDVAHAANFTLPEVAADLPSDLKFAIFDQVAMLFDARGTETKRPEGLSMAAARIAARYRRVSA